jgi:hypothetical protein
MKKELGNILVGGLVLMAVLPALANEPTVNDGTPQVTVRVLDYAGVPLTTLRGAQREAGRILSRAGVKAVWPECFLVDTPAACHQRPGTNELTVRILRRPKGKKVAFDPLSGGVAIRIGKNTGSGFITLYYNRTEEIAEEFRMKRGLVQRMAACRQGVADFHPQAGRANPGWISEPQLDAAPAGKSTRRMGTPLPEKPLLK